MVAPDLDGVGPLASFGFVVVNAGRPAGRLAAAAATVLLALALGLVLAAVAAAEQASQPGSAVAAGLDAGQHHSCAIVFGGSGRCFGYNADGELGLATTERIGDNETPGSVAPVDLGPGRTAKAITAGGFHTCALLDNGTVRCWGFGGDGRLGGGNIDNIGDDEVPGAVPPVNLGAGRTAVAISAGFAHTCAVLDDASVRCWGHGANGALGQGGRDSIGDGETPGSLPPVDLGEHTAKAITAGSEFTCALLDDDSVSCWGYGFDGRLGYGDRKTVGDDETPASVGSVNLGAGHTAHAISAGDLHTCALLDDDTVRCWGVASYGSLGYGDTNTIGDDETPASVGPVDIGAARTARAISAGGPQTCALLDNATVRCWGANLWGQLGYGNTLAIGDDETPGQAGPVSLGRPGTAATAISAGRLHTCVRLSDSGVRCWGYGGDGRLGLCNELAIGDDELPSAVAPVALDSAGCGGFIGGSTPTSGTGPAPLPPLDPQRRQAARLSGLRACLSKAALHKRREMRRARHLTGTQRTRARRHLMRHEARLRRRCLRRWGRTPGRVTGLQAKALSRRTTVLTFDATGTDGTLPPPAQRYLVKQSRRPIESARAFRRAEALCRGSCRFPSAREVGQTLALTISHLRGGTAYYYAVAARDNVSRRLGRRSKSVRVVTQR